MIFTKLLTLCKKKR